MALEFLRKTLLDISECTGISLHWLLTGEGEKYPTANTTTEPISTLEREGLARSVTITPSPLSFHSLPIVAALVSHQLQNLAEKNMVNVPKQIGSENSVLITVQDGEWMAEGLQAGDLIVAEVADGRDLTGRTVIALCDGRAIVRKFEQRGQLAYFTSLLSGSPYSFPIDSVELAYVVTAIVHAH